MPQGRTYDVDEVDHEALRKSLDDAHRSFYQLLGYYITRWAHFDRAFFELCKCALGVDDELTASVFYRSPNLSDHLALTHRLLDLALKRDKELCKQWVVLKKRIDKGIAVRNYVAHQPVAQRAQKIFPPNSGAPWGRKTRIEEGILYIYNEFLKPNKSSIEYIGTDELKNACDEAGLLLDDLQTFIDAVRQQLPKQPE